MYIPNLNPCPICGTTPEVTQVWCCGDHEDVAIECPGCGFKFEHTYYYHKCKQQKGTILTISTESHGINDYPAWHLWNKIVSNYNSYNYGPLNWFDLFPKCKNCKSRPDDNTRVICMCSESLYCSQHPQEWQDTYFKFGTYEEMETNE